MKNSKTASEDRPSLRVLVAEDNPRDAKLMQVALSRSGFRPLINFADSSTLFQERIERDDCDIIICDYNMRDWTAIDALNMVRSSGKDIPFIVVSGSLGDEAAAEIIRLGATDYVLKDRMARLPAAIQRALEERAMRQEHVRAEQELHQSEERFRLLVESAEDYAIFLLDPSGLVASWNTGAERIHKYQTEEIIGQDFSLFYSREDVEHGTPVMVLEVAKAEGRFACDGWLVRKDASQFWANVVITSLRDPSGELVGFSNITRDLTERKNLEDERYRARELQLREEEAVRANESKSQFLSTMSHELRTPLNAILGFSELLGDSRFGALNDRQSRYIGNIHSAGKHLLRLINDILDLSKIEAGRMELTITNVDVQSVVDVVLTTLRPLAEKQDQILSHDLDSGLVVRADATRFTQVLMNLVGNAIKFTPAGGKVEIKARREKDQVALEVQDTGPGIPADEQKRIFESFYRMESSSREHEGTGLGLAISQRLLVLHGSQLNLVSELGQGSCFSFRLPLGTPVSAPLSREERPVQKAKISLRILVVDDDPVSRRLIKSQLNAAGHQVIECDRGQNAAGLAAELQPDAITLDLLMRPTSGWEVMLQLKFDSKTRDIPIIVVTMMDQPARGAAVVADEYLTKPVEKASLLAAVDRCFAARGVTAHMRPILVVEDNDEVREVVVEILSAQGYTVTTAADGNQARESVAKYLPEMVILDLMLPKTSGLQLLSEWRAAPRTADLPIFVLTGKDLSPEEESYLRVHTESLFRKQTRWEEDLVEQLRRVAKDRGAKHEV